jgi:predicted outer membrane protein
MVLPMARLTPAQELTYARLSRLSGRGFDQAFLAAVAVMQQETRDSFSREAFSGRDPGMRDFASRALPRLDERARLVQRERQLL